MRSSWSLTSTKPVKFYRDVLGLKVQFESAGWSEFVTGETLPPKKQDFGGALAQFVDSEGALAA